MQNKKQTIKPIKAWAVVFNNKIEQVALTKEEANRIDVKLFYTDGIIPVKLSPIITKSKNKKI
jgi:hypothetical protein